MAIPLPQVVLLGDSLFQGACTVQGGFSFQAALEDQCIRCLDVVNRGHSGYNTSNTLKLLPQTFAAPTPGGPKLEYLLVFFGANDAARPQADYNQNVPLDKFKEYLTKIITHPLITAHSPKILLITPPPLDEIKIWGLDQLAGLTEASRTAKITASYAQAVREVAASVPGTTLIDLWKAIMDVAIAKTPGFDPSGPLLGDPESGKSGYLDQLLPDGLHMSGESYQILWDVVRPHITPGWEAMDWEERLAMYALPEWRNAPFME